MPFLVAALLGGLATAMGSLVGRLLIALGVGFVTYQGISFAIDGMKQSVISGIQGLPGDALALVGYLWIDKGITIIFSAVAASIAMRGLGGAIKKAVFK